MNELLSGIEDFGFAAQAVPGEEFCDELVDANVDPEDSEHEWQHTFFAALSEKEKHELADRGLTEGIVAKVRQFLDEHGTEIYPEEG